MTFFSAFSGAGGFELALRDHTCVGYSEINRAALAVYRYHFPDHPPYGDIRQLDPRDVAPFDLLVAGFPCQAYSVAGQRRGFADARGALFFDLARFIAAKRPRLLLLGRVIELADRARYTLCGNGVMPAVVRPIIDILTRS
jgi:DNA (cytosine-5)-methyltransferase 1